MTSLARTRKSTTLTAELVQTLTDRVRTGIWTCGTKLPREADLITEFGVSRTVVREAMSRLQAAGIFATRHGIGTFVVSTGDDIAFRVTPDQLFTLQDVINILEVRMAIETEAAGLAAMRHHDADIEAMQDALNAFDAALDEGRQAIGPDLQLHLAIARATQNPRFAALMEALGGSMIPRARLSDSPGLPAERVAYLRGVNQEHRVIVEAIERRDSEGARAAMRTHLTHSRERRRRQLM
jgi:GntR family transcriptional regulator, transcriptional repressor for pyruvate dehydrogenase complex